MGTQRCHFRAGFAVADITPDLRRQSCVLGGQPASGVRDRLEVGALVLGVADEDPVALICADRFRFHSEAFDRVRGASPLPDARVLFSCSGVPTTPECGPDLADVGRVAREVGDAVRRAAAELVPCRLGWGTVQLSVPHGPELPMHLLKIERAESTRTPICAAFSLRRPAVTVRQPVISVGWVGELRRVLPWPSLFLPGLQDGTEGWDSAAVPGVVASSLRQLWDRTTTAPSGAWAWSEWHGGTDVPRVGQIGTRRLLFWPGEPPGTGEFPLDCVSLVGAGVPMTAAMVAMMRDALAEA